MVIIHFLLVFSHLFISVLLLTCTKKDEPILISGAVDKSFTMKPAENAISCNGYCFASQVMLDATMSTGKQAHIRTVHFTCLPIVEKTEQMCKTPCTSNMFDGTFANRTIDRTVGALRRLLKPQVGDFSYEKAFEKLCCCKTDQCARKLDARLRLSLASSFKISKK